MGGGGGGTLGTLARVATAVTTFGLSEAPGAVGKTARDAAGVMALTNPASALSYGTAVAARTAQGVATAPQNAANAASEAAAKQNQAQADLLNQIKLQPQVVQPDNFQATKNRQLNSLRMGIAATMKYGGAAPITAAPTLKTKLGQ
jgi:hypothetical protein